MNCEQTLKNRDDFLDKALSIQKISEIQRHLDSCPQCREEFQKDEELLAALRTMAVPPPQKDFIKYSFVTAQSRYKRQRFKAAIPYLGGAVAACLAFLLIMAGPFQQTTPSVPQESNAINIKINEQRLVQVVVRVPHDLLQADIVIELPPQVEMEGFPGRREIRWHTDLRKGKNLLNLPLIAKSAGRAELITHINHANKSKMLSLVMNIDKDKLTRQGHVEPSTA